MEFLFTVTIFSGLSFAFWTLICLIRLLTDSIIPRFQHYTKQQEIAVPKYNYLILFGIFLFWSIALLLHLVNVYNTQLVQDFDSVYQVVSVPITMFVIALLLGMYWRKPIVLVRKKIVDSIQLRTADDVTDKDVAVIIPAHNEETSLDRTLQSLKRILPASQIYVGSDASTDRTVQIVKSNGCNVVDIWPNKGKAGVLKHLLTHFDLISRYKAVLIVDADTQIDKSYLQYALPLFNDKTVAAVAGHAKPSWSPHTIPKFNMLFAAYRIRLYVILQGIFRYGQTWKYTSVTPIVPGFCSTYRTDALKHIDITAPGLIIEDFNMTFEVHHKKLGRVDYRPDVFGVCHEPETLLDYAKQVKRWSLGFWQTVRFHGIWPGLFWTSLSVFLLEMFFFSLFFLSIPFILLWLIFNPEASIIIPFTTIPITFLGILISVVVIDYFLTVLVSIIDKKPVLLLYGPAFLLLRYIDSFMFLYTLPLAFIVKSDGRWTSPKRA